LARQQDEASDRTAADSFMIGRIDLVRPLAGSALLRRYICDTAMQRRRCAFHRAAPVRAGTNKLFAPRPRPSGVPPVRPDS